MLQKIWIVFGAVALVTVAYVTAFAVEEVQQPVVADGTAGGAAEANTWTVCSSGCDFNFIQNAVDSASDGDTIQLGAEAFNEVVTITQDLIIAGAGRDDTYVERVDFINPSACDSGTGDLSGLTTQEVNIVCYENVAIDDSHVLDHVSVHGWSTADTIDVAITTTTIDGFLDIFSDSRINARISDSLIRWVSASANYGDPMVVGELVFDNTTISGGAELLCERVRIRNSTIVSEGIGLALDNIIYFPRKGYRTLEVSNSIIAGVLDDCWLGLAPPAVTTTGSLFNQDGCGGTSVGDITYTDPLLLPLADNGGPTPTHALAPGSPAIDAGDDECLPTDQRGVARPQDGDGDGVARCDIGAYELERPVTMVGMDIKPDGYPNSINPGSRGVIPVAILGSDTFDVVAIDETTLSFGPGEAHIAHRHAHFEDVNLDGIMDLATHYRTQDAGIACGDESATLTGETLDGQAFAGSDSIQTVGCRETRRPAIWAKDRDRLGKPRSDGPVNIERK